MLCYLCGNLKIDDIAHFILVKLGDLSKENSSLLSHVFDNKNHFGVLNTIELPASNSTNSTNKTFIKIAHP